MPRQLTDRGIRLNNIAAYLTPALTLLDELNDALGPPFVHSIARTTLSLLTLLQKVKRNKDECLQLMEKIHIVLYAIVNLHLKSDIPGSLPPDVLDYTGKFMETLRKIYTYVEAQQDGNKIKLLFRQSEMNTLLKDCRVGLDHAFVIFKINTRATFDSVNEMKQHAENMHVELLELVSTLSDGTVSDRSSSVYQGTNDSKNSSNSFTMLPSKPKIFHGRESEMQNILKLLDQESPRIAILGGGGMGKTSLAKAILHHSDTVAKFEHRFFVSAESATTSVDLSALIGLHLGLEPGKDLTKPVVQYFSRKAACLLILDNLETPWEPIQSRKDIEELLSLITEVSHLALIITMRGAERPGKVHWTHPFLLPLEPFSDDAARETFLDITDNSVETKDMHELLQLTDNMPLAVDLIAHVVDYEGASSVLARWAAEKTSLLSAGHDRKSNLRASITISLSSPRLTSGAKDLLSLLSILPDGLSDVELVQINLPIDNVRACRAVLLATSLAYQDDKKRLRSLMPIREYIRQFFFPGDDLTVPVFKHLHSLLELYQKYDAQQLRFIVDQITFNLGNLDEILLLRLHAAYPGLADTIHCTLSLNSFYRTTKSSKSSLMDCIPAVFPEARDHLLETSYFIELLRSPLLGPIVAPEMAISQAIYHFQHLKDPVLEAKLYLAAGGYSFDQGNVSTAVGFVEKALTLARLCGDRDEQCSALILLAWHKINIGDYSAAQICNREAHQLAKLSGNLYQEARVLWIRARCSTCLSDYRNSILQLQTARNILSISGMSGGQLDHRITEEQAEVHLLRSEYSEARSLYAEVIQLTLSASSMHVYAYALLNIALIDIAIGKPESDVLRNLDKAQVILHQIGDQSGIVHSEMVLGDLSRREQNTLSGKCVLQKCLASSWGRDNDNVIFTLERLADISSWGVTDAEWQSTWPVVYFAYASKLKEKLALHKALLFLGDVCIFNNDGPTAHSLWTVALEGLTYMDVHRSRAQCMLRLGDLANKAGDLAEAMKLWKAARPLFERSLQVKDVFQIDTRLANIDENCQRALDLLTTLYTPAEPPKNIEAAGIEELENTVDEVRGADMVPVGV